MKSRIYQTQEPHLLENSLTKFCRAQQAISEIEKYFFQKDYLHLCERRQK